MVKRGSKKSSKKGSKTGRSASKSSLSKKNRNTERILIENFVSMQKVMTNLSLKFEELSKQISKLLELFEFSAKTIMKKDFSEKSGMGSKEIEKKLDNLLEQNKIISRGLTLLHETNQRTVTGAETRTGTEMRGIPTTVQSKQRIPQSQGKEVSSEEYQKSISSPEEFEQERVY